MIKKTIEKNKAIELRKMGLSVTEIARTISVAKSSVSIWVRSVPQPEKFTAEFKLKKRQEKIEIKRAREKGHPSDSQIDLHIENVQKTGEPLLSRRPLTGDGRWMIPAPSYYLGKKYINNRYIYEHRFIVEKFLGRLLKENETVCHLDGNKLNNKIENLKIKYRTDSELCNPYTMRVHSRGKYKSIVIPTHPYADKRGRVLLHRYIKEQEIGRYLTPDEVVHHKDENTRNNDIKNLEIVTVAEHNRHHNSTGRAVVELVCSKCNKKFTRFKNRTRPNKDQYFCSKPCANSYYTLRRRRRPIPHGTKNGYGRGCRCPLCTKAQTDYAHLWRINKKQNSVVI